MKLEGTRRSEQGRGTFVNVPVAPRPVFGLRQLYYEGGYLRTKQWNFIPQMDRRYSLAFEFHFGWGNRFSVLSSLGETKLPISSCSLMRRRALCTILTNHHVTYFLVFSTLPFITQSLTQMFYDLLIYLLLLAHFINDSFDNPIILRLFTNFITSSVCLIFFFSY